MAKESRLHFEDTETKPPSKLAHAIKTAPLTTVSEAAHRKTDDAEDENVGVESAEKTEEAGEEGFAPWIPYTAAGRRVHLGTRPTTAAIPPPDGHSGRESRRNTTLRELPGIRRRHPKRQPRLPRKSRRIAGRRRPLWCGIGRAYSLPASSRPSS